jgi:hypothetical protein
VGLSGDRPLFVYRWGTQYRVAQEDMAWKETPSEGAKVSRPLVFFSFLKSCGLMALGLYACLCTRVDLLACACVLQGGAAASSDGEWVVVDEREVRPHQQDMNRTSTPMLLGCRMHDDPQYSPITARTR